MAIVARLNHLSISLAQLIRPVRANRALRWDAGPKNYTVCINAKPAGSTYLEGRLFLNSSCPNEVFMIINQKLTVLPFNNNTAQLKIKGTVGKAAGQEMASRQSEVIL